MEYIGNWRVSKKSITFVGRPYRRSMGYSIDIKELKDPKHKWIEHLENKSWFNGDDKEDFMGILEDLNSQIDIKKESKLAWDLAKSVKMFNEIPGEYYNINNWMSMGLNLDGNAFIFKSIDDGNRALLKFNMFKPAPYNPHLYVAIEEKNNENK